MTAKQPPAQKHLELVEKIMKEWLDNNPAFNRNAHYDLLIELRDSFASCIAETEAAALAGPSDEAIDNEASKRRIPKCIETFAEACEWYRSQIKLTHESAELVLPKEKTSVQFDVVIVTSAPFIRGFNEALDAIKKLNPHLKTRVEGE